MKSEWPVVVTELLSRQYNVDYSKTIMPRLHAAVTHNHCELLLKVSRNEVLQPLLLRYGFVSRNCSSKVFVRLAMILNNLGVYAKQTGHLTGYSRTCQSASK